LALLAIVVLCGIGWLLYEYEARIFNFDDGPYSASEFIGEIDKLPIQSRLELKRFGELVYVLESCLFEQAEGEGSVLVLRRPDGTIVWKKVPLKPDGLLGAIALGEEYTHLTWHGGWKVAIKPAFQESGYLYLGPFGDFRFFYHSW
jgi:hypothetical protein